MATPTTADGDLPTPPAAALVGRSPAMNRVRELIFAAAAEQRFVMLRGEAGVGKSLAARVLIAQASPRLQHVVRIRCGGLGIDEAEGRLREVERLCARGKSSMLHLDEIGEAEGRLQDLICGLITDLKGRRTIRIVATTARDVEGMARKGSFRTELCASNSTIWIPPLRVRRADIADLVRHFRVQLPFSGPDGEGMRLLEQQEWPGNVRQLRMVVRRLGLLYERVTGVEVRRELLQLLDKARG